MVSNSSQELWITEGKGKKTLNFTGLPQWQEPATWTRPAALFSQPAAAFPQCSRCQSSGRTWITVAIHINSPRYGLAKHPQHRVYCLPRQLLQRKTHECNTKNPLKKKKPNTNSNPNPEKHFSPDLHGHRGSFAQAGSAAHLQARTAPTQPWAGRLSAAGSPSALG